jgi:hypothetical protein
MPEQNNTSVLPLLGITALAVIMAGLVVSTPPRNDEPIRLPEPRTVAMPLGFAGPMSQDWVQVADSCPGEEIVRFERPEGLPEYERDMWTCAKYVEELQSEEN